MLCLWLAVSTVRTGTYDWTTTDSNGKVTAQSPTYSGGVATETINGVVSPPQNFVFGGHFWEGRASVSSVSSPVTSFSTLVTGTKAAPATATFTWQPSYVGELPPATVIIQQYCTAGVGGYYPAGAVITESCSNGLGAPQVATSNGANSASTLYTVRSSPGASFSISLPAGSPSASWSGSAASGNAVIYGDAAIAYTATPVTINLGGGIGLSSAMSLLVGQQLTASLNPGGLSPTTYNWSVSGGNPFDFCSANSSYAIYLPLGSQTSKNLVCYFAMPQPKATVSCTAHLAVPAGASPAGGLNVTATQTLNIDKPSVTLTPSMGNVADLPTTTNPSDVQLQQVYYYPANGNARGFAWNAVVTTPAAYVLTPGAVGIWNWTQLLTSGRQEKNNGVYWQVAVNTTTPPKLINGLSVLDGQYPYGGFWYPADGNGNVNNTHMGYGNSDSPNQSLDPSSSIRAYDVLDSFQDFLMYGPPGSNSVCVPLQETDWYWEFHATKDNADLWNDAGQKAQWGSGAAYPAFPVWTLCAPVDSLIYVSP